jgi:hypothetical protein
VAVPDPAALGLEVPPPPERPVPAPAGAPGLVFPAPAPGPVPSADAGPGGSVRPAPGPEFGADERLNLRVLEREAERLLVTGRILLVAGLLGAGIPLLLPGWTRAEMAVAVGLSLFLATVAWIALRAARASCLATIALAQRQREILRSVARG